MESNPLGDMFLGMKKAADVFLAEILDKAVNGGIITESQRNEIYALKDT